MSRDVAPRVLERLVETLGAQRPPEDEEHGPLDVEAEVLRGLRAGSRTVEGDHFLAQRHADDLAAAQRGAFEGDAHCGRAAGTEHVRQPRLGIGLVHHEGHTLPTGGDVRRG